MIDAVTTSLNPYLDLNLNLNSNPDRILVNNNLFEIKEKLPNSLHEPILFELVKQRRVSHARFIVTGFVYFSPCLQSFDNLENYTVNLAQQLIDLLTDNINIHMESNLFILSFQVPDHSWKNLFTKAHQKAAIYLEEVFQALTLKFLDALYHLQHHLTSATKEGADVSTSQNEKSKEASSLDLERFLVLNTGGYDKATIDKIKRNLCIFQENQYLQQKQICKEFPPVNQNLTGRLQKCIA